MILALIATKWWAIGLLFPPMPEAKTKLTAITKIMRLSTTTKYRRILQSQLPTEPLIGLSKCSYWWTKKTLFSKMTTWLWRKAWVTCLCDADSLRAMWASTKDTKAKEGTRVASIQTTWVKGQWISKWRLHLWTKRSWCCKTVWSKL